MQKITIMALAASGLVAGALASAASTSGKVDTSEDAMQTQLQREPKRCSCMKLVSKTEPGLRAHTPA